MKWPVILLVALAEASLPEHRVATSHTSCFLRYVSFRFRREHQRMHIDSTLEATVANVFDILAQRYSWRLFLRLVLKSG
ncbi:unnamed protein product [Nippostrongylus brasiliensis]|uniref:Secreted protein n=1 Tax=Nippostrongylus brasiliensis TaxID=27835 RepID=A0A0N4XLC0_NIPBR|nr:unnamed protein product [Nippostrongylus brasiliensis]